MQFSPVILCNFTPVLTCPRGGPASELCLASRAGAPSFHCEMQLCSASGLETVTEPRRACAVYERLRAGARVLVTGRERQRARVLPIEGSEVCPRSVQVCLTLELSCKRPGQDRTGVRPLAARQLQ